MEWNRIESKWNEMARRLQHKTPQDIGQDAVNKPSPKTSADPQAPSANPTAVAFAAYVTSARAAI